MARTGVEEAIVVRDAGSARRVKEAVGGRRIRHLHVYGGERLYFMVKEGDDVERHVWVECENGWECIVTLAYDFGVVIFGAELDRIDCRVEIEVDEDLKTVEVQLPGHLDLD